MNPEDKRDQLSRVRQLCHQLCSSSCVEQRRRGLHDELIKQRPGHWSVTKLEEQHRRIDLGDKIPFDIALPLPARDPGRPEPGEGVRLFWERFKCQNCGRCCYTPGAGLYLEEEDFERISNHLGSKKKMKALCRYDKTLGAWILKQPCPFYDKENKKCEIYEIRPQTCTKYPLHPPLREMPYNLAVDAFCPAAREITRETLPWWIVCEANWARILASLDKKGPAGP